MFSSFFGTRAESQIYDPDRHPGPKSFPLPSSIMDFSTQTRLKLRVAIISANTITSIHHLERIVGVKREATGSALVSILKQFLLLIPLDSTFADLKSFTRSQYEKLYKSQAGYLPLKNILLFQDSNQCDLDEDYLVADICASNDLVYAVVEVDDQSNKKIKISNAPNNPGNQNNQKSQNLNQQQKPKQQQPQAQNSPKAQNEKMVPEFKPSVPQKNASAKVTQVKLVEVKNQSEIKAPEPKRPEVKVAEPKKDEVQVDEPVKVEVTEFKIAETIKAEPEAKISATETTEVSLPVKIETEVTPVSLIKEQPLKVQPKKIQKPEARKEKIQPQAKLEMQTKTEPVEVIKPEIKEPVIETKDEVLAIIDHSVAVPEIKSEGSSERSQNIITPGPTPTPISRPTSTAPIFHPRKSSAFELASSSSEDSDEEADASLKHFDACNLFGSQVIASEPRRSDAFVLFTAGSSSEDEDSGEEGVIVRSVSPPTKSSSIISLQAGPSSEVDGGSSDEESVVNESNDKNECILPQSVTLRRLSSVSPIPDPSEIPSLDELKESLCRAPTPIQILAEQKQQPPTKSPKKFHYHHHNTQNNNNNKRGRPAKKHVASGAGRPAKK